MSLDLQRVEHPAPPVWCRHPALPDACQALQETRCRLDELVPEIQERVGPVDLEEGAEERLADLRAAVERLVGGQLLSR